MKTAIKKNDTRESTRVRRNSPLPFQRVVTPRGIENSYVQRVSVCPCDGGCPRCQGSHRLQSKLKIGAPNDKYEQEADRVADQVMRMPDPAVQRQPEEQEEERLVQTKPLVDQITPLVQRQPEEEEEEEETLQMRAVCELRSPLVQRQVEENEKEEDYEEVLPAKSVPAKSKPHPTGIEKTSVEKHKLHFGARYKHTLKSSGGSLEGIRVSEKVTVDKDDFRTKLPGVELGVRKPPINKKNEFSDRIWISFGAIAPSVKRLREKKKSAESFLGTKVNHQELYYWDNSKPPGWKKFADVKIEQRLYDLPGLIVVTIDNDLMAQQEDFTPFPPRKEERKQLLNSDSNQTAQNFASPEALHPKQKILQPKQGDGRTPQVTPGLEKRVQSLNVSGQPLPVSTRAFFQPRFGYDFSQVRVHTDARAAETARSMNARAFTTGRDLIFGIGQYAPETTAGKRLLAHELTHVVQQTGEALPKLTVAHMGERTEQEAAGAELPVIRTKEPLRRVRAVINIPKANIQRIKAMPTMAISQAVIQAKPRRRPASKIIPDLDTATVEEMKSLIRYGKSKKIRQELIDYVISDRQRKGMNFQIMEKGKPVYVATYPAWVPKESRNSNGITVPPGQKQGCPGDKPCVFIGPQAFGGANDEQRVVRLYSTIMHEYQHAKQWQEPRRARALGKSGREVEAFFWEIENSDRTGLSRQRGPFKNVWDEAKEYWQKFKTSQEWQNLKKNEKQRYINQFQRLSKIAKKVLGVKR